jgi:hypothetical protein
MLHGVCNGVPTKMSELKADRQYQALTRAGKPKQGHSPPAGPSGGIG